MFAYDFIATVDGWRRSDIAMQGAFPNNQQVSADLHLAYGCLNPAGVEYK